MGLTVFCTQEERILTVLCIAQSNDVIFVSLVNGVNVASRLLNTVSFNSPVRHLDREKDLFGWLNSFVVLHFSRRMGMNNSQLKMMELVVATVERMQTKLQTVKKFLLFYKKGEHSLLTEILVLKV